jgi:predicted Zn-dependent protease
MAGYTLSEIAERLGLSRSVITGLIAAGFVTPARGAKREYRFSFQDMVLLRAAQGLQAAQVPTRRILQSLRQLRERLPEEMPLAGIRIGAMGREVVVREGGQPWRADSGQLLFDFDTEFAARGAGAEVHTLRTHETPAGPRHHDAGSGLGPDPDPSAEWFQRGAELETRDPARAEAAYRRAIALQPALADAYLNLGALLAERGRHDAAIATYHEGLARCPREALLHYNLAVALEDVKRIDAAIAAYDRCLALDATMADAHFNVARLHEQQGRAKRAIRHYSAYRRLREGKG